MAGVIGLRGPDIEKRDILQGFKIEFEDADRPYVRPHTGLPVLTINADGDADVHRHVFGFSRKFSSFNARDDKLESSNMWSRMFGKKGHHGVAPVSYILEWGDIGKGKQPFRIERADGSAMCVPALVGGYWEDKAEDAFSLVTIEPNAFVKTFHSRMIGQLNDEQVGVWLNPEESGPAALWDCLTAPPNDELVAIPIKHDAGKAKFDDASALEAIGDPIAWADLKDNAKAPARQATLDF